MTSYCVYCDCSDYDTDMWCAGCLRGHRAEAFENGEERGRLDGVKSVAEALRGLFGRDGCGEEKCATCGGTIFFVPVPNTTTRREREKKTWRWAVVDVNGLHHCKEAG